MLKPQIQGEKKNKKTKRITKNKTLSAIYITIEPQKNMT